MSKFNLVVVMCAGAGFGVAPALAQNQTWSVSVADAASVLGEVDSGERVVLCGCILGRRHADRACAPESWGCFTGGL